MCARSIHLIYISQVKKTQPSDRSKNLVEALGCFTVIEFDPACYCKAQTEVTSILAGIINATTPLMTLLVMLLVFREERVSRIKSLDF